MPNEQSFSSQVEAVMQRGRTGEQNPLDEQMIQEVQGVIEQGHLLGEGVVAQALATSTAWQATVESFRNTYRYGSPEHEVLDRLKQAISTVTREDILASTGIPRGLEAHSAGDHREQFRELRQEVRGLARRRLLAQLTDPRVRETDTMPLHSETALTRYVDAKVEGIIPSLGMADLSKWVRGMGESEKWQEARANHQALTDATVLRFLEGLPLRFSRRAGGNHAGSTIEYQAPMHEAMRDEQTKARYKEALQIMLDGLYTDTDWTEEQRNEEVRERGIAGNSFERLRQAHETFESHLFDGIQFDGQLRPGVDLRASLEHNENTDKDGARTASFARGAALRILVEGGDTLSYTVAVNTLPQKDKERLAVVAQRLMSSASDANERARLGYLLREAHLVTIDDESRRAEPDRAAMERENRESEAQLARQALREQLERRMLTTSADRLNNTDLSAELQYAFESPTGHVPEVMRKIGSNLAWAHVVEGLFMRDLDADLAGFVEGTKSLSEYTRHATQLYSLLDRLSEVNHEHATISMSSRTYREPLDPEIDPNVQQRILVLARLSGLILSDKYVNDANNQAYLLASTLQKAQSLGVTHGDILDAYNRAIIAVAKHNEAVSPDSRIQMQDGLAYTMQNRTKWKIQEGNREIPMELPQVITDGSVSAPGIESYSIFMQSGSRTDGHISMVHLRGQDNTRQVDEALERDAELWTKERIVPLEQVVGDVRRARGYPETASTLVSAKTKNDLGRTSYDPPRENAKVPDSVGSSCVGVEDGVKNLRHLAGVDASEKARGATAEKLLQGITGFRASHGAELANPRKMGPMNNYSKEFKIARDGLTKQVSEVWKEIGLPGKPPNIDSQASLDQLEQAIRQKDTESKSAELVAFRGALGALDQAIPSPEDRALRFLAEYTQPPYNPKDGRAVIELIKMPPSQNQAIYKGKTEYPVRDLLADPKLFNSVAQALVRGCLVNDHGWSKPIYDRVKALRGAAKANAPGSGLSEEVNDALFAIEQKLAIDPSNQFYPDIALVARQVLVLFKENLQPLLGDATLNTVDTSAVASVSGGELKEKLDRVVVSAKREHKEAAESLGKWQI